MENQVRIDEQIKGSWKLHELTDGGRNRADRFLSLTVAIGIGFFSADGLAAEADAEIDQSQKQEQEKVREQEAAGATPVFPRIEGEIVIDLQND